MSGPGQWDDLARELLRREARLRAWKAYGLPVLTPAWQFAPSATYYPGHFLAACTECGRGASQGLHAMHIEQRGLATAILATEDEALRIVLFQWTPLDGKPPCTHLHPLRGKDPPEVLALTELELIAGG